MPLRSFCLAVALGVLAAPASSQNRTAIPAPDTPGYADWKASQASAPARLARPSIDGRLLTPGCSAGQGYFIGRDDTFVGTNQGDDSSTDVIDLGFSFDLYGTTYDQLYINANGNVTFDAGLLTYNPEGFPINLPMVAPYWADWDFRAGDFAEVYYKVEPGRLTVIWEGNSYNANTAVFNRAQLVLTDGRDPLIGIGNNVGFAYEDMQWYAGSVSNDAPATVGVNKGDGSTFAQIGLFGVQDSDYFDGAAGARDGVDYLDCRRIRISTTEASTNIAPVSLDMANGDVIAVEAGTTYEATYTFTAPERNQSTVLAVGPMPANFGAAITETRISRALATFSPTAAQVGESYDVAFTVTDDGAPALSTTFTVTFVVEPPGPGDMTGGIDAGTCSFPLPSGPSRCFLQLSGTNELPASQRYTVFLRVEGTDGATSGVSRMVNRGEIKLGPFESATNKMAFRSHADDPDGAYEIVLLTDLGSLPVPTAAAVELGRFPFVKGGAGLRTEQPLAVYPNPASGAAQLRFSVPGASDATLVVYDALGREVARLLDGAASGPTEARLDAEVLPAGVYVARLLTDRGAETVRFSVVR